MMLRSRLYSHAMASSEIKRILRTYQASRCLQDESPRILKAIALHLSDLEQGLLHDCFSFDLLSLEGVSHEKLF